MTIKNFGKFVAALAGLGIVLILLVDLVGLGKPGLQAAQLSAILFGVLVIAAGVGLAKSPEPEKNVVLIVRETLTKLLSQPVYLWVMVGFGISYFLFFISPTIFNPDLRFSYYNRYLPEHYPIGGDFILTLDAIKTVMLGQEIPQILYPPLLNILFSPFLLIDYPQNYYILSAITLLSLLILVVLIPKQLIRIKEQPLLGLVLAASLLSYGLQFELERGQSHTLAFMFCLVGIYLFHKHPNLRGLSYLLFSISIQIKVYPVIFVFLFIDDWRAWPENIKRFIGLGLLNAGLLFLHGAGYFVQFYQHMLTAANTQENYIDNHSVKAFLFNLTHENLGQLPPDLLKIMKPNAGLLEIGLIALCFLCLGLVLWQAYRENKSGLNLRLLFACTMLCLLVPALNHDYTLGLLAGAFVLFSGDIHIRGGFGRRIFSILLIISMALAYSATFYPFKYRPLALASTFPMLLTLLLASTALTFILPRQAQEKEMAGSQEREESA
ncbi:MAG: glycosyltransferase 87 family protein [Anaerolineales bacterium]|jgi:hypothetical protein|nr:glycosyltransferase 87 family protein [Anaerolineales bacterium]